MDLRKVQFLVAEWDEVYKKGQLSLWVLLAIYDGKKYAAEIVTFMEQMTGGSFEVREQSLYRALRRFKGMGLVTISTQAGKGRGPQVKCYELTAEGEEVLRQFVDMNIAPLFNPAVVKLFKKMEK